VRALTGNRRKASGMRRSGRVHVVSDLNYHLLYLNERHICLDHDYTRICMRHCIGRSRSGNRRKASGMRRSGRVHVVSDLNCHLLYLNERHICLDQDYTRICVRHCIG